MSSTDRANQPISSTDASHLGDDERTASSRTASAESSGSASSLPEDHSLFSLQPILRWLKYVASSVRRAWPTAIVVFIVSTLLGGVFLASSPSLYQTSSTILLAGDQTLGGSTGGSATASRQADSVIRRSESLDRMITELNLIENKPAAPVFGMISDRLFGLLGPATRQQEMTSMRAELRAALAVFYNDTEASIQVFVLWPDAEQAASITSMAYDIFLEERTRVEIGPLQQSVGILAERALRASKVVNELRNELDLSPGDGAPSGSLLEGAVSNEQALLAQLRVVEVELAQATVSVPSRYALLAPPEVPVAPVSGSLTNYLATLIFACLVTGGVCFLLSRPSGTIVEPWQLERFDVPVLITMSHERS